MRDHLISLILEGSSIVDLQANHWINRLDQIVGLVGIPVIDVLVLETIDRFASSTEDARMDFSLSLVSRTGWMEDVSLGLVVAATAVGGAKDEGTRLEMIRIMSEWLSDTSRTLKLSNPRRVR